MNVETDFGNFTVGVKFNEDEKSLFTEVVKFLNEKIFASEQDIGG